MSPSLLTQQLLKDPVFTPDGVINTQLERVYLAPISIFNGCNQMGKDLGRGSKRIKESVNRAGGFDFLNPSLNRL